MTQMNLLNINRLSIALFVVLLALLCFFSFSNLKPSAIFFANDQSTDFIVARLAEQGTAPLLGPPSHTGGRHLGPLYYWFVIAGARLADFDIPLATGIYAAGKLLAFAGLLIFLAGLSNSSVRPALMLGAFFLFTSIPVIQLLRIQWHSNYLIIPSFLAVLTGGLVILRSPVWLPAFLIALTVLGLSHLSASPVVLGLFGVILTYSFLPEQRNATWQVLKSGAFLLSLVVVLALLSYPLIYELNYSSNLQQLFQTHTDATVIRAGVIEALLTAWRFFAHFTVTPEAGFKQSWPAILLACSAGVIGLQLVFNSSSRERWFLVLLIAPLLLTTMLLVFFKTPLHKHYFNSSIAIPFALFLIVISRAALIVLNRSRYSLLMSAIALLMLSVTVVLIPFRILNSWQFLTDPVENQFHSLEHVQEISRLIREDAGTESPLVFARLSAKPVRNGYYYLLNDVQLEAEYSNFFPELPDFLSQRPSADSQLAYLVSCPKPYSFTRKDLLQPFDVDWFEDGELVTDRNVTTTDCSIIRLRKIKQA